MREDRSNDMTRNDDSSFGIDESETFEEDVCTFDLVCERIGSVRRISSGTNRSSDGD